jgi:hypothetical protein
MRMMCAAHLAASAVISLYELVAPRLWRMGSGGSGVGDNRGEASVWARTMWTRLPM